MRIVSHETRRVKDQSIALISKRADSLAITGKIRGDNALIDEAEKHYLKILEMCLYPDDILRYYIRLMCFYTLFKPSKYIAKSYMVWRIYLTVYGIILLPFFIGSPKKELDVLMGILVIFCFGMVSFDLVLWRSIAKYKYATCPLVKTCFICLMGFIVAGIASALYGKIIIWFIKQVSENRSNMTPVMVLSILWLIMGIIVGIIFIVRLNDHRNAGTHITREDYSNLIVYEGFKHKTRKEKESIRLENVRYVDYSADTLSGLVDEMEHTLAFQLIDLFKKNKESKIKFMQFYRSQHLKGVQLFYHLRYNVLWDNETISKIEELQEKIECCVMRLAKDPDRALQARQALWEAMGDRMAAAYDEIEKKCTQRGIWRDTKMLNGYFSANPYIIPKDQAYIKTIFEQRDPKWSSKFNVIYTLYRKRVVGL